MSKQIKFAKVVGTGNDFVIIDAVRHKTLSALRSRWASIAKTMCDRRHGIGADGVLVLEPSRTADCRMRVFNTDGSEAEMCGNGARCAAAFVARWPTRSRKTVRLETIGGGVEAEIHGERVQMSMPEPKDLRAHQQLDLDGRRIEFGFVNTGVPHAVVPVEELETVDVERLGRRLRYDPAFGPRGTNVNFIDAHPRSASRVRIRTYERGVEGETLACGTGAVAAAIIAAVRRSSGKGTQRVRMNIETRGGDALTVAFQIGPSWRAGAPHISHVILEGPVQTICEGTFVWPLATTSARRRTPEKAILSC